MTLRRLRAFAVVAEELHFGRAARRLYVSQPALSQQILKLEKELGVALLDRSSRRVELTAAGADVLAETAALLARADALQEVVDRHRAAQAAPLAVGFTGSAASRLLPGILERLRAASPGTRVALRELTSVRYDLLRAGDLDVVLGRVRPDETPDLDVLVLAREPRVVVLPRGHRLAGRASLRLSELAGEAFITQPEQLNPAFRRRWLAELEAAGLPGRIAGEASSVQEFLGLVAAGRGVCLAPQTAARFHARPDVAYVPVADAQDAVTSLVTRPGAGPPALQALRRAAVEAVEAPPDAA